MTGKRCAFCHAERAPFGFRIPGARNEIPEDLRDRHIWTCSDEGCQQQADDRVQRKAKQRGLA